MMKLIKYEGYKVTIEPEILLLKPFKKIYTKDRSTSKDKALSELGFIYFFADPRSDYQYIIDDDLRMKAIKEGEGLPENWKPDKDVLEAIELYKSFKPMAALLLEDTRVAIDKIRVLLKTIDLNEKDDKGKPIYTLNTITSTIKQIPSLVKDLDEAEKALAKEVGTMSKMRGGQQEKSLFEDNLGI